MNKLLLAAFVCILPLSTFAASKEGDVTCKVEKYDGETEAGTIQQTCELIEDPYFKMVGNCEFEVNPSLTISAIVNVNEVETLSGRINGVEISSYDSKLFVNDVAAKKKYRVTCDVSVRDAAGS